MGYEAPINLLLGRTGNDRGVETDSSDALSKVCPYELKTASTKERSPTELRCASFPAPHATREVTKMSEKKNTEGRHVGLDFYDLLIEGHFTQNHSLLVESVLVCTDSCLGRPRRRDHPAHVGDVAAQQQVANSD